MGRTHGSIYLQGVTLELDFPIAPPVISHYQYRRWGWQWTVTFLGLMPLTWALINTHCHLER